MDAMAQYEGAVTPHGLSGRPVWGEDFLRKLVLRVGRVVRVHTPTEATNRNGRYHEYDVLVDAASEDQPATRFMLHRCWVVSEFGGAADYTRFTPRVDGANLNDAQNPGTSSQVLVMCLNASMFGGIIVGGVQHSQGVVDANQGHNRISVFNGFAEFIDKDGQLKLTFGGATNADGTLAPTADPTASGASLFFRKDGSVILGSPNGAEEVTFDHTSQRTTIVGTQGVTIGTGSDQLLKGTTFRNAQTQLHAQLQTALTNAAAAATTAVSALATTGAGETLIGSLNLTPVVGPIISAPLHAANGIALAAAAASLANVAAALTSAVAALTAFEAGGVGYLSTRNNAD